MKMVKALLILVLLSGFSTQAFAGSKDEKPTLKSGPLSWILGDIIIKRPPINDDGPGGNDGN